LIIKWEKEDSKLPVSLEIEAPRRLLRDEYDFEIESFVIPKKKSHARVDFIMSDKPEKKENVFAEDEQRIYGYDGSANEPIPWPMRRCLILSNVVSVS
jgi:hypothetical protein